MDHFRPLSEGDVRKLIERFPEKTCILDPMPTSLVINCIDVLLPVITKIINLSLGSGSFASNWKCALVNPLLKKSGLDLVPKNYRPVSNLQFVSNILTERAVFNQFNHSPETALMRVMNDILLKMNTVTHDLLLDPLRNELVLLLSLSTKSASLYTWNSVKYFFWCTCLGLFAIYSRRETSS